MATTFTGKLWREGQGTPFVVTGTIDEADGVWSGRFTLERLAIQPAETNPKDWKLMPDDDILLRVDLTHESGSSFSFVGSKQQE